LIVLVGAPFFAVRAIGAREHCADDTPTIENRREVQVEAEVSPPSTRSRARAGSRARVRSQS
jgi:hypothetical protein